jgi:hypothetical protein
VSITQIRKGSSDPLVWYPPEDTAPASASLVCTTVNGSELSGYSWPQTVSRDSASATVSVEAKAGARAVSVSSTTGFTAGETYLLTLVDGRRFRVRVAGVGSGTLYLDQPLSVVATTAATLTGLAYRFSANATMTATVSRRCRAQWSYTAGGVPRYHQQRFDIVREPWALTLTETDIERYDHTFGETAGSSGRWLTLVEGVAADLMRWLEKRKLYADLLKDRDYIHRAGALGVLARFYGARPGKDAQDLAAKWTKAYEAALVELADANLWYDADDSDTLSDPSAVGSLGEDDDDTDEVGEIGLPAYYAVVG